MINKIRIEVSYLNKELKKLNRKELLEILLEQTKRIEELETEVDNLKNKLESKKVIFKNAGSLADASLQLSGIFNVAQEAAEIYLNNIKELKEKGEQEIENLKTKMLRETARKCKKREKEADEFIKNVELEVKNIVKENPEIKEKVQDLRKFKGKRK